MNNTELQFEMAMRDQIIYNQREAQRHLWNLLMGLGLEEKQLTELAAKQGITIEDWAMTPQLGLSDGKLSRNLRHERQTPSPFCHINGQLPEKYSDTFPQNQVGPGPFLQGNTGFPGTVCREVHNSSYFYMSDKYPSTFMSLSSSSENWISDRPTSVFQTPNRQSQGLCNSFPQMRILSSPYSKGCLPTSTHGSQIGQQQKVRMQKIFWNITLK